MKKGKPMTLDEAIKHAEERANADCSECASEHRQLAEWLKELKTYKSSETVINKEVYMRQYYIDPETGEKVFLPVYTQKIDKTLEKDGKPADAKVVGDKFRNLEQALAAYIQDVYNLIGGDS